MLTISNTMVNCDWGIMNLTYIKGGMFNTQFALPHGVYKTVPSVVCCVAQLSKSSPSPKQDAVKT